MRCNCSAFNIRKDKKNFQNVDEDNSKGGEVPNYVLFKVFSFLISIQKRNLETFNSVEKRNFP